MATYQAFKFSGAKFGANYEIKNAVFKIKTAKNFTDLEQALTINYFSDLDIYDDSFAEQFKHFKRGYLQRALGQGIRFIETYGASQVRKFIPAQPGSKVCLEIPNNRSERSETIGRITRCYSSCKEPDILDAFDLFVDPVELAEFVQKKIGLIKKSVSLFLDLTFSYILSLDPWGDKNADYFNSFTIGSMLGAKWDDTAISIFGDDKEGVGAILKSIQDDLKDEIDKETKLKNVNSYDIWQWAPFLIPANAPGEMKKDTGSKAKKPTAALDTAKLKKIYYTNKQVDPNLSAAAICNCLSYHAQMMTEEFTAQNDSMFCGNLDDKFHEYGKTATTPIDRTKPCNEQKGSGLRDDTPTMFTPIRIPKEELIIIMNSNLYKDLKSASLVATTANVGAYNNYITNFMSTYGSNIVKLDTMPYGAFKIGSKNRYNQWDLYDKIETDKLGQADVVVHTAHRGIAFGIRQYRPFKYIRLTGLFINPHVRDINVEYKAAVDII